MQAYQRFTQIKRLILNTCMQSFTILFNYTPNIVLYMAVTILIKLINVSVLYLHRLLKVDFIFNQNPLVVIFYKFSKIDFEYTYLIVYPINAGFSIKIIKHFRVIYTTAYILIQLNPKNNIP